MADQVRLALERLRPSLLPGARAQKAFDWQMRLTGSQWAPRDKLESHQLARLKLLVGFASRHALFWRERIAEEQIEDAATLAEALARLPILSRDDLRDHGDLLRCETLPQGHRAITENSSSGSTGMVVRVMVTNISLGWQNALGLRSHLWAGRDFARSIAIIRRQKLGEGGYPGIISRRWARAGIIPFATGPAFQLSAHESLECQWEWLKAHQAAYLLTVPSIVRRFAEFPAEEIARLSSLTGISTIGEVVDPELRALARDRLHAPIHDMYSSEEAGCMAIQCPREDMYHVPAEAMILEILDEAGRPTQPGQTGRVVVTPLFNFATPLIRYELGDYAEAAEACPCRRTLPALKRIMGRRRNILATPDGRHFWPTVQARGLQKIVRLRAHQFRQIAPDTIEVCLAMDGTATPEQEEQMRAVLARALPAPFDIRFRYIEEFPPHPGGKHEEFVSLLTTPSPPRLD